MVGDDEIEPAVAVVIRELGSHARSRFAIPSHGHSGEETHFAEAPATLVVEQKIGHTVVGDKHVGTAVIVVIAHGHSQAVADVLPEASLRARVGKSALAIVEIQDVRQPLVHEWMAVDADATLRVTTEAVVRLRRIEVVGDEEIEIAVDIDIEEGTTGAPSTQTDTSRARDVSEGALAHISIERFGP